MTQAQRPPVYLLKLEGKGDAADIRGLRAFLKLLLRRFGLRCCSIKQVGNGDLHRQAGLSERQ
jgi:hypothetical protein